MCCRLTWSSCLHAELLCSIFFQFFFIPRCVLSWFYFLLALCLLLFLFFIFFLHGSKQTLETKHTQKGPLGVNDPPNASVGKCTSAEPIHRTGISMKTGRKGKYDLRGWEMTLQFSPMAGSTRSKEPEIRVINITVSKPVVCHLQQWVCQLTLQSSI